MQTLPIDYQANSDSSANSDVGQGIDPVTLQQVLCFGTGISICIEPVFLQLEFFLEPWPEYGVCPFLFWGAGNPSVIRLGLVQPQRTEASDTEAIVWFACKPIHNPLYGDVWISSLRDILILCWDVHPLSDGYILDLVLDYLVAPNSQVARSPAHFDSGTPHNRSRIHYNLLIWCENDIIRPIRRSDRMV